MRLFKAFPLCLILCLALFTSSVYCNYQWEEGEDHFSSSESCLEPPQEHHEQPMQFKDPVMANLIMKELDIFEPYYNRRPRFTWPYQYIGYFLGMKIDNEYCDKHRNYFAHNPGYVFNMSNYVSSYIPQHFARVYALDVIATNAQPKIQYWGNANRSKVYDVPLNTSLYVTGSTAFYKRHVMKQFSCLGQMSNHIPGHDSLYQKDKSALALAKYKQEYKTRPECLAPNKYFPKNYLMSDQIQCLEFFKVLNSERYKQLQQERNVVFIRKVVGKHAGAGITPVNKTVEEAIRKTYQDGARCGLEGKVVLMQQFIHNPMLIHNRKSDFRLYMLVASTNPLIAFYHDGYFRISSTEYDPRSSEKSSLVTNSAISPQLRTARKTGFFEGKTYAELKEDQSWLFGRLQKYLLDEGMITDPDWVENHLRPEAKKAMIHLLRSAQHGFLKRSSVFELYGVDFMLDDQLNLWFIEANALPGLSEKTPTLTKFEGKMLRDEFDIIFRLLRSRMKRIFNYVNKVIMSGEARMISHDKVEIQDLEAHIQEFRQISSNRFEPEFEPLPDNGFFKIIDENYSGTKRYSDILSDECL